MERTDIIKLLKRYNSGQCTVEEIALIETFYMNYVEVDVSDLTEEQLEILMNPEPSKIKKSIYSPTLKQIGIAASIMLMVMVLAMFSFLKNKTDQDIIADSKDIAPGKNSATLILSSGKKIILSEVSNEKLAQEAGVKITKTVDGELLYELSSSSPANSNRGKDLRFNTLSTSRGEQYKIRLPDSSIVWLNAASSLKYPTSFTSLKERRVELKGEAYFQVAKDKSHPFYVSSKGQEVKVLGTRFNVNSYDDEPVVKTTLLEGSVKINTNSNDSLPGKKKSETILNPGQQAQLTANHISVINNADLEDVIAWKDGYFIFNENLKSIMNRVGRWYDVEVVYETVPDPNHNFQGKIARTRNISEVLKIMEYQGIVHFKIEGRRVIVTK
ncbi:FecR family protein [Pedobacter sp. WC2423]|uniref:FecR family protein n=1 Tax=Pedobacter sp. WC2423 TaxID=3234142 RepID=UPI0034669F26